MKPILKVMFLSLLLLTGCSSPIELASHWGNAEQKAGETVYIRDQNLAIGIRNDGEYLYLTLDVADRSIQRQVFFQGLTVWFDREGGENKRFGIHYPMPAGPSAFDRRRDEGPRMPDTSAPFPDKLPDELEIIGPAEGEHNRMHMDETKGISINLRNDHETLVYELVVPLTDSGQHLYGIGTRAGGAFGLGIESGGIAMQGRERGHSSDDGRNEPPRGGGGRRGSGGPPGGGRPSANGPRGNSEPIRFWAKVTLAGAH